MRCVISWRTNDNFGELPLKTHLDFAAPIVWLVLGLIGSSAACSADSSPTDGKVGASVKSTSGGRSSSSAVGGESSGEGGQQVGLGGAAPGHGGEQVGQGGIALGLAGAAVGVAGSTVAAGGVAGASGSTEEGGVAGVAGNLATPGGVAAAAGKTIAAGGVAGVAGAAGSNVAAAGALPIIVGVPTATVTLTPDTTYQTLEGFGAAIAWYQVALTTHKKSAEIYQTIFGDLGLDVLRLRNTFGRSEFANAAKDKAILDAATASLGRRPKVLMTSWSPPAALKANNVEKCSGELTCTLKKTGNVYPYAEFATYWYDAIAAYRSLGISPDWVSIQNETDYIPNGWEGCKFTPSETASFPGYAEALVAVSTKFSTLSDAPKLIGPETLGIHWNKMQAYMPALNKSLLWAAAHHLYERGSDAIWDWRNPGPDSFLTVMKAVKATVGELPILQTEFQTDEDNNIDGGFETAWLIHNSLAEEGVSGWLYWDLVWGAKRGMVSLPDTTNYSIRDQYYSMRHYSLYTDPGYIRVGAASSLGNIRVTAFRSPDQKRVTLVLLNVGTSEEQVGFALGGYVARTSEVYRTVYVPGSSVRWAAQPAIDSGGLLILPSRSVATVVLNG